MLPRLTIALTISLALHGSLFLPDAFRRTSAAPPRPALQAVLRLPPKPEPSAAEALLKNTLDSEAKPEVTLTPTIPLLPEKSPIKTRPNVKREVQIEQKKLSKYVFYPEAARAQGIEGTVELLITLTEDGVVEDVQIINSSGYPILDNAAAKGAWAAQKLPGNTGKYPWSYTFRLVP